mmetsp:Transcript_41054/g.95111  ORF Transcript_41054/g.95111 Transcript_41054/m.95111 type:complete len:390 (+) Transcript_41054:50-1219(+)
MESAARNFLERACEVAQDYDREGQAVLPNRAWPLILEDLGLQEDGDAAYFLMDHLKAEGDGFFSYTPLLQALGAALPEEATVPNAHEQPQLKLSTDAASPLVARIDARMAFSLPGGQPQSPHRDAAGSTNGIRVVAPCLRDATLEEEEEVGEAFWARRGSSIQQLFTQWDCNQLSNEAFTAQLQALLGDLVDVSSPESEFVRKTNQHRSARNLKFAALMAALRRDAHTTLARREGRTASSYAGSTYEPSEVGIEAASHAAGRPTGATASLSGARSGRRQNHAPPWAAPDPDFWSRTAPSVPAVLGGDEQSEVASQAGTVDDAASAADLQRSEFTLRNRTGHGNILTWGADSRSITPHKKRQGRQLTVDPEQGIPRSHMSSVGGIFQQKR